LLGWPTHIYFGLFKPEIYQNFGDTGLWPGFTHIWQTVIMPHICLFALLLAAHEIVVGLLLINKGIWVKLGLVLSIGFQLFLVQLGLSFPAESLLVDFLVNRVPNLAFILIQIPLLWGWDEETILETIRR
jgi:hypothetical protein